MKKFIASLLALGLLNSSANAVEFYNRSSGQWSVVGQTAEPGLNQLCMAATRWGNGAQLRLIQDLKDNELYIYYENPAYNIIDPPGSVFSITILFDNQPPLSGQYEVAGRYSIRIRDISHQAFLSKFAGANIMELRFPGSMPTIRVGLSGTRNSMLLMSECVGLYNKLAPTLPPPPKPGINL